jgi:predicted nuclease of predicted toxin-antitoxin system
VRLLLDENLSFRLAALLADAFPGTAHVRDVGLSGADDDAVWEHARAHGMAVASKDSDFHDRARLHGPPPRLVWIRRGTAPPATWRPCSAATAPRLSASPRTPRPRCWSWGERQCESA